jgi:hypothetical protein
MRLGALPLAALICCLPGVSFVHTYPHGTVVFTLAVRDGFVMAADGLTILVGGELNGKPIQRTGASEPKIAICGHTLLCGMAGVNPFPKELKIEYDFQDWISDSHVLGMESPQQFAEAIAVKAKITFRDFGTVLASDPFWRSKNSPQDLLEFQIAGYIGEIPQVCDLHIGIDRQLHQLVYPKPEYFTPLWESPSPTSVIPYPLSLGHSIEQVLKGGTPEAQYAAEILPGAVAVARILLPDSPSPLQEITGNAAAFVRTTDAFNPDQAGGVTTIGVLQKGRLPRVFQFPN